MIKIASARLKDHADNESRILWGIAYDAGETTIDGKKWETTLALDELGWLHIWRTNLTEKVTRHARVPPDMIRIAFDADPGLLDEPGDEPTELRATGTDPAWRHPKAVRR